MRAHASADFSSASPRTALLIYRSKKVPRNYERATASWYINRSATPPSVPSNSIHTGKGGLEDPVMLQRAASASAAMVSGYRMREAVGACTESLGSESGDVGGDAEIDQLNPAAAAATAADAEEPAGAAGLVDFLDSPEKRRRTERRLPPAMPRAAEAFMRAERRGGRLILTEVVRPVERREVFHASRADGRLLLRFADDDEERESETGSSSAGAENGAVVVGGSCCNGAAAGFRHVAAGAGRCVELGAVVGT